jgi:hypothetical protein
VSASAAEHDAALLVLAKLGITAQDLLDGRPAERTPMPTFRTYIPIVSAAVTDGTRRVYGSYWNRILAVCHAVLRSRRRQGAGRDGRGPHADGNSDGPTPPESRRSNTSYGYL